MQGNKLMLNVKCSLFVNTCTTCENTNEDEQDFRDLFEDVEIMEMMAKCLSEQL